MSAEVEKKLERGGSVVNRGAITETTVSTTGEKTWQQTHYSGSGNMILNNGTMSQMSANNRQSIVMGADFQDVRGSKNLAVAGKKTEMLGDVNIKVGSLNAAAANLDALIKDGIHKEKAKFEIQRTDYKSVYNSNQQSKSGAPAPCPECSQGNTFPAINSYVEDELNKLIATPLNFLQNFVSGIAKKIGINITLPNVKLKLPGLELISFPPTGLCEVCRQQGLSPWSYEGEWAPEPGKEEIQKMYEDAGEQLAGAEESMGAGGNYLVEVSRNMMVNVGMAANKMSDIRVDNKGKKSPYGITIGEERVYQKQAETPLVEKVHVDDLMGGTYTVFAGNGANFVVGARGLNFDCFGSTRISGSRVDIGGAQVNIASKNEVNLRSDSRLALEGKVLSLKSSTGQVLMENNMGVTGNLIVQGGAHIEGEAFLNHVTAPMELQKTEKTPILYGQPHPKDEKKVGFIKRGTVMKVLIEVSTDGIANLAGSVKGMAEGTITIFDEPANNIPVVSAVMPEEIAEGSQDVQAESAPDKASIYIYPHNHLFRNIPLTLTGSNKDMRKDAAQLEGKKPVPPSEVKLEDKKGPNKKDEYVDEGMWTKNSNGDEAMTPKFITMESSNSVTADPSGEATQFEQEYYKTYDELSAEEDAGGGAIA